MGTAKKTRLDQLVVQKGLLPSREMARRYILAGEVLVNGNTITRAAASVPGDAELTLKQRPRFVSRGGEKLAAALAGFGIDVAGLVCADVGASTGGFTDCLLQGGAARVYAVDVGYGQLDWTIRQDERVVVMERVNARFLETLPEEVAFVCIDVSFISLRLILPVIRQWLKPGGQAVALVKPQFEAGRDLVGKGGVVKNPATHRAVLSDVTGFSQSGGFGVKGLMPSPLLGPAGNREFLMWLEPGITPTQMSSIQAWIEDSLSAAPVGPTEEDTP